MEDEIKKTNKPNKLKYSLIVNIFNPNILIIFFHLFLLLNLYLTSCYFLKGL